MSGATSTLLAAGALGATRPSAAGACAALCIGALVVSRGGGSRLAEHLGDPGGSSVATSPLGRFVMGLSATALVWAASGTGATLVAVTASAAAVLVVRARRRQAAADLRGREVVRLCAALSAELAAGVAPVDALRRVVRVDRRLGPLVAPVLRADDLGGDVADAWRRQASRVRGAERLADIGTCWAVSERTGSSLGSSVGALGESLGRRARHRAEVDSRLAGARSTARLLAALPLAGILLGSSMGANPAESLIGTGWGRACLAAGIVLDVIGLRWSAAVRRRAAQA